MKIQCCYSNYHTGLHVLLHRHWSFLLLLIKDIRVLWHMYFVSWRLTHLRLLPFLCHSWCNLSDMTNRWEFFQWYACFSHQCWLGKFQSTYFSLSLLIEAILFSWKYFDTCNSFFPAFGLIRNWLKGTCLELLEEVIYLLIS